MHARQFDLWVNGSISCFVATVLHTGSEGTASMIRIQEDSLPYGRRWWRWAWTLSRLQLCWSFMCPDALVQDSGPSDSGYLQDILYCFADECLVALIWYCLLPTVTRSSYSWILDQCSAMFQDLWRVYWLHFLYVASMHLNRRSSPLFPNDSSPNISVDTVQQKKMLVLKSEMKECFWMWPAIFWNLWS